MRVTKEPEQRKQEILNTAMKLFCENGYERTSMSDIAKEMNVAQGLCYRYFPSKESVFDMAMERYADILVDHITEILTRPELTLKQIILEMPTFMDVEENENFSYKLFRGEEGKKIHNQICMCVCNKMLPIIKNQFDMANERREIHLPDTETAASFFVYGQLGILLQTNLTREEKGLRIKTFLLNILKRI